jgi:hypothetical protein
MYIFQVLFMDEHCTGQMKLDNIMSIWLELSVNYLLSWATGQVACLIRRPLASQVDMYNFRSEELKYPGQARLLYYSRNLRLFASLCLRLPQLLVHVCLHGINNLNAKFVSTTNLNILVQDVWCHSTSSLNCQLFVLSTRKIAVPWHVTSSTKVDLRLV